MLARDGNRYNLQYLLNKSARTDHEQDPNGNAKLGHSLVRRSDAVFMRQRAGRSTGSSRPPESNRRNDQLLAGRRRGLGRGAGQPPAHQRRPRVVGRGLARRAANRRGRGASRRQYERHDSESRRQHRAVPARARDLERARTPDLWRSILRDRYAEPRVFDPPRRRLSDRRRPQRQCDHHRCSRRPGRSVG